MYIMVQHALLFFRSWKYSNDESNDSAGSDRTSHAHRFQKCIRSTMFSIKEILEVAWLVLIFALCALIRMSCFCLRRIIIRPIFGVHKPYHHFVPLQSDFPLRTRWVPLPSEDRSASKLQLEFAALTYR